MDANANGRQQRRKDGSQLTSLNATIEAHGPGRSESGWSAKGIVCRTIWGLC